MIVHTFTCRADVKLNNGGEIHVRCFGRYKSSLWDEVFAELPTLTEIDVIIINFGAWYPRFNYNEPRVSLPYINQTLSICKPAILTAAFIMRAAGAQVEPAAIGLGCLPFAVWHVEVPSDQTQVIRTSQRWRDAPTAPLSAEQVLLQEGIFSVMLYPVSAAI